MKPPEFSETQFVFAYMTELVKTWAEHVVACPEFPTQRREGKDGGGYDVRLESSNGFVYFAQFKTSEYCDTPAVIQSDFGLPFYRFRLRTKQLPNQHELLRALELQGNLVEYVAPCFHKEADLQDLYVQGQVRLNVRRVRPARIGEVETGQTHFVVFEPSGARPTLYSTPKPIEEPDYGEIVAGGFESASAFGERDAPESLFAEPSQYEIGSLAHRLDAAASTIARAYGVMSMASMTDDPYLRLRSLARALVGCDVVVVQG